MSNIELSEATCHPLALYRNHVEFSGYRVEEGEEILFCRHPRKPNLMIKAIGSRGVLVSNIYSCQTETLRSEILEYVNDLNAIFLFIKAYIDADGDFVLETFFEGEYDRTNFSILLENIEDDVDRLFRHELTAKYIR